ncbi:MAG: alpha/beta hydrolase [Acidimicrobiales bacterium]|nr:alpha/beta hydrolase [Acidimicrobiales bacterium]
MAQPKRHVIASTDGVELAVHDHGGAGPTLVFCHATGLHGRVWDPVADALGGDVRRLAVDLRGHGGTHTPPDTSLEWSGMARDLLAVVDALADGGPVLAVGHSMGGATIVLAELARPGTIDAAWLFEPIIVPRSNSPFVGSGNPLAAAARRRREVFDNRDAAFERYGSRPPFVSCDPRSLRAYVDHGFVDQADGSVILACRGETEARVFEGSEAQVFERLGEVAAPLVVASSGDGAPPALVAPHVAGAVQRGRHEHFADLTHFGPLEAPERIAASIRAAVGLDTADE